MLEHIYDQFADCAVAFRRDLCRETDENGRWVCKYICGDSNWKDKLTSYNSHAITYDAIGNPLNDGTWTYTWGAGRQLRQMSKRGMTVQFQYDHNGLRVGKTVNGVATNCTLHGKLITHLTKGSDKLHFFYDAQSRQAKVSWGGTMYTYVHNLQGDLVGILDNNGALVIEYKYDAWAGPSPKPAPFPPPSALSILSVIVDMSSMRRRDCII